MKLSLFQGIVLGVFAVAALIGLFVFSTYKGSSSQQAIGRVVIWGTLPQAAMQQTLAGAVQTNSALKGVTYAEQDPNTFETALVSAIAGGTAPDLILISQEDLVPLAKVLQQIPSATLSAASLQSSFADGASIYLGSSGVYGVPYLIDPLVLYANSSILSSSGIAQVPSTWEALTGLVSKIVTFSPSGNISRALIALGSYSNVHNASAILSSLFLQTGVPISTRNNVGLLNPDLGTRATSNGVVAGQAVLRFYTQFADPSKVSYTWNGSFPDSQSSFVNGDLALYAGYASEASFIAAANPNLSFVTAPLPQPASSAAKTVYGKIYALAIPRGSANPAGALLAAIALAGSSSADAAAATATGLAPALRTDLATVPTTPTAAVTYQSALYTRGWLSPAPSTTDGIFSTMITNVTSGRLNLDAALANAQTALGAALQQ